LFKIRHIQLKSAENVAVLQHTTLVYDPVFW